ncbi:hypothetical protein [uncultured Bradyrhizobium sp.]|uniref:hypothetical protein n=1 Tax=uncultured Bradyrhizobium sp. TaxID=199684 RepID=UPI0035CC9282
MSSQDDFALMLGNAALTVWGDIPRELQEALFEHAMRGKDDLQRTKLAKLLHERHPRTMHPARPAD